MLSVHSLNHSDRPSFASVSAVEEEIANIRQTTGAFASPTAAPFAACAPEVFENFSLLDERNLEKLGEELTANNMINNISNANMSTTITNNYSNNSFENTDIEAIPEFKPVSKFLTDFEIRSWWASQCDERPEFKDEDVFNKYGGQYGEGTILRHVEQQDLKCKIVGSKFSQSFGNPEAVYVLELCADSAATDLLKDNKTLEAGVVEVHQHWDWILIGVPAKFIRPVIPGVGEPVEPVISCMRGGRTLVLSMEEFSWTENFYLNNAWQRFEHVAYCDRQRWNKEWVMAGENVLLEYEIVIIDDKFLDCEWDSFSPALKTYFRAGGGVILLGYNNRPNLIPKLNDLIGCRWEWEGVQRHDQNLTFEVTPRCRQLYEKPECHLGDSVSTTTMNLITVPARERLLKALPEEDLCEDENIPEEDRFHNLPDEFTPCGVHYGQLQEGAQRPGMVIWFGCGAADEHEFWPQLFREVVAQRIEKQKKRRRRQKKNKKGGKGEEDNEDGSNQSESNYGGNYGKGSYGQKMANALGNNDDSSTRNNNESAKSSPSFFNNPNNRNPSKSSSVDSVAHAASYGHGNTGNPNGYSKSSWGEKSSDSWGKETWGKNTSQYWDKNWDSNASSVLKKETTSAENHYYYPHNYGSQQTAAGIVAAHHSISTAAAMKASPNQAQKVKFFEDALNFGNLMNFDPTKHRIMNQLLICKDHFSYVCELHNGHVVQYQQAGNFTYFFVSGEIFQRTKTSEWKWMSKKEPYGGWY